MKSVIGSLSLIVFLYSTNYMYSVALESCSDLGSPKRAAGQNDVELFQT